MAASLSQPSWSCATWRTARSALLRRSGGVLVHRPFETFVEPPLLLGRERRRRSRLCAASDHRARTSSAKGRGCQGASTPGYATSLAAGGDCKGRAHLAHPRGSETAHPSDQPGPVNALDVIEADRGVVIEPFVRADDDLAGKVANGRGHRRDEDCGEHVDGLVAAQNYYRSALVWLLESVGPDFAATHDPGHEPWEAQPSNS